MVGLEDPTHFYQTLARDSRASSLPSTENPFAPPP